MQLLEGNLGPPDVTGVGPLQQTGTHDLGGKPEGGRVRGGVQGGDGQQFPQRFDRSRRLTPVGQPTAERDAVHLGPARVQPPEPVGGKRGPQSLAERKRAVPQQRRGQVQRRRPGDTGTPQPGVRTGPGKQHRDVQPLLQGGQVLDPEPAEEPAVSGTTAHEDVLAGVDPHPVPGERGGGAAQSRSCLQHGHVRAGIRGDQRGRQAGQPATDHDQPVSSMARWHRDGLRRNGLHHYGQRPVRRRPGVHAHAADTSGRPARLRAATTAFSQPGSESRWCRTGAGSVLIRRLSRR